ncbi:MAG: hypothetical protein JWR28_1744 [Modestobacter sp.]|nr:hypothetical protein [Modestobacter sp.]
MPIEPGRTSVRRPTAPPRRPRPAPDRPPPQPETDERGEPAGPADDATDPAPS